MKMIPWGAKENLFRPGAFFGDFDSLFRGFGGLTDWAPALDVQDEKDAYSIQADLPGMKKDEIKVNLEQGVLTISGERHNETDGKDGRYERSYGSFSRSILLPGPVEEGKVKAEYKDGVLSLRVPKAEAAKTKTIHID
jgi:HSP20 family protein